MMLAFTTSWSPSARRKIAMISSAALPKVNQGPSLAASSSVARPISAAVAIPAAAQRRIMVASAWKTNSKNNTSRSCTPALRLRKRKRLTEAVNLPAREGGTGASG